MKSKTLIILGILVVAGGIAAGLYFYEKRSVTIEEILPEGAVVYLYQKDLTKLTADFNNTTFGKQLAALDVPELLDEAGIDEQQIQIFHMAQEQFLKTLQNPVFQKFFGQEMAIASYPVKFNFYNTKALFDMVTHTSLVIRLDKETELLEFINRAFQQANQQVISEETKYKNHAIVQVTVPQLLIFNFKLSYTKIGQYLVASLGEENIHRAIDAWRRQGPSLAQDKNYLSIKSRLAPGAQTVTYLNLEMLATQFKEQFAEMMLANDPKRSGQADVDRVLGDFAGFKGFGYSAVYGPIVRSKMDFSFDKDRMTPRIKQFYSCEAIANKNIQFVHKDALLYQWSNCYDLASTWAQFKEEAVKFQGAAAGEGSPSSQEVIAGFEKLLKLSIEKDIMPVLGKEQGWVLYDVESSGAFPIPKFLFFINIKDRAKAEQMMTTILDQPVLFVQNESYKNININYISTPVSVDIQPAYCFLDNYLLLASSRHLFRTVIDAHQDGNLSLAGDPEFKELNFDPARPVNGMFFLRMDDFSLRLQKVIEWGSEWLVAKSKELDAYKTGSQKRLTDLELEMQTASEEVQRLKARIQELKLARQRILVEKTDPAEVNAQIADSEAELTLKETSVVLNEEKRQELKGIIDSLGDEKSLDPGLVSVYLDKLIYPALKAFAVVPVIGSELHIGEDYLETTTYIKIQEQ